MTRNRFFSTLFTSDPLVWSVLGLFFSFVSCFSVGEERVIILILAPVLFLASFFAWIRSRWLRWLTLIVGIITALLFTYALVRLGPSLFIVGFLLVGVYEIFYGLFGTEHSGTASPDSDEDQESERRPRKRKRIATLLKGTDPSELFSVVFDRIVRRYGGDLNVMHLRVHERVFLLAYDAWGIIGNGGFHYLFERNIPGDPHFEETAAAFSAIGCETAAQAFAKVFRLFPDGRPPENIDERLHLYRQGPGERRGPTHKQFFAASKEIEKCLYAYIRRHAEEFTELERLPPQRRLTKKRKRRQRPDEDTGPTAGDVMGMLPHWARVAFAARCARQVWPLFERNWPNALAEHTNAVQMAMQLAEQSAAKARPEEGLKNASQKALQTAGQAMLAMYGIELKEEDDEPMPPDGNAALVASFMAKTAEKAAETANSTYEKSTDLALQTFGFARQAAGDTSDLIQSLWRELIQLERIARRGEWTNQTPAPPNVWDLLD